MASSAVTSTLQHVTDTKLRKLSQQWAAFRAQVKVLLDAVNREADPVERVRRLLEGLEDGTLKIGPYQLDHNLQNIRRFLHQARHDASITTSMLAEWQQALVHVIDCQEERYKSTELFGRLVTQWITNPNHAINVSRLPGSDGESETSESSFEAVGREEMYQQRKEWESYAFNEFQTDPKHIKAYLDSIFASTDPSLKLKKNPLETLRTTINRFEERSSLHFDAEAIRTCIHGIIKGDLFSGEKRKALLDLESKTAVLKEMADVLNADIESLESWSWDPSPVSVSARKEINGKYRVHMDEELYEAIFLQFIGVSWAVHLKNAFYSFFNSGAWIQAPFQSLSRVQRARREHYIGPAVPSFKSIRNLRRDMYKTDYFMTQLPSSFEESCRDYGAIGWEDNENSEASDTKSPMAIKQSMLRLVTAEILINTHIYGQVTVLQSDFKWFGPSMPHSTIFAVLEYLNCPPKWIRFFTKFLTPSLVFADDGPSAAPRVRRRGIPMCHVLSDALGEAVMFCLDFDVNRRTNGANLHRFHDDLWFWGQPSSCLGAWEAISDFARVMGLALNEEKTGTVHVARECDSPQLVPTALPKGDVRWGFLKLDATSGRWLVDKPAVDVHVTELKLQLAACNSIFAYIQAYNAYLAKFFVNNLGIPAHCLGHEHIDLVVSTLEGIQNELFGKGSINGHLRKVLEEQFHATDIPDGFFYFPTEFGGLEVHNPLIYLYARRDRRIKHPEDIIGEAVEEDILAYEAAKERYEAGETRVSRLSSNYTPPDNQPFMPLSEFMKFREETSKPLAAAYSELLMEIHATSVPVSSDVRQRGGDHAMFSDASAPETAYLKWLVELYGREVIKRFGRLRMGEREQLPIGLLDMLKSEKVRWQG